MSRKHTLSAGVEAVLSACPQQRLVKLADGVLDSVYGVNSAKATAQYAKHRHILRHDDDGAEKVTRTLKYLHAKHPRRERPRQVPGYFRRNHQRMGYAVAKAHSLPIGSGIVEAACKTLVSERMKCSGMRWRHPGGQVILTLRAHIQSNRFDRAWALLSDTYKVPIAMFTNVVPLRPRLAIWHLECAGAWL
ncbi:MAG: hypothetical protein HOI95_24905 [Chromatiales bacterium]|nr:hypothetical protein [Chromatiales bacterium]